jgi:hypothetical protein
LRALQPSDPIHEKLPVALFLRTARITPATSWSDPNIMAPAKQTTHSGWRKFWQIHNALVSPEFHNGRLLTQALLLGLRTVWMWVELPQFLRYKLHLLHWRWRLHEFPKPSHNHMVQSRKREINKLNGSYRHIPWECGLYSVGWS